MKLTIVIDLDAVPYAANALGREVADVLRRLADEQIAPLTDRGLNAYAEMIPQSVVDQEPSRRRCGNWKVR